MSSDLERAAKAAYEANRASTNKRLGGDRFLAWEELIAVDKKAFLIGQRAALLALREPSKAMERAGSYAAVEQFVALLPLQTRPVWQAMIDAILKESA